jgi:prepilin-type N-terminal cleavage/methylation domain-containing protein
MKLHASKSTESGFTMIELLCSMFLFSLVTAGMLTVFTSQQGAFDVQEQVNEVNQNTRAAIEGMTREIRMTRLNGFSTANGNTVRFQGDLDQDGAITSISEDITYAYDANTNELSRSTQGGTASVVAENITAFSFLYTLANGTQTSTPANLTQIRKISISITAQTAYPDSKGQYRSMTLTSDITPRNMALGS